MKKLMAVALTLSMALILAGPALADMVGHEKGASMKMHHIHILMGHGLGMVTEGTNLVMIAAMKMSPGTDGMTGDHGQKMIDNGKSVVQRALSGDEMMKMHKEGMKDDPMMKDTHGLGESILKYIDIVQKMKMDTMDKDMMDMHHMHLMINHALAMAAEGSNLVMLGDMKMAGDLDKYTVDHGRKMLKDAKATLAGVSDSKAMMGMHKAGKGPKDDPMMAETHNLIETALKIIDYFEKM
jgi:hypothetical protein